MNKSLYLSIITLLLAFATKSYSQSYNTQDTLIFKPLPDQSHHLIVMPHPIMGDLKDLIGGFVQYNLDHYKLNQYRLKVHKLHKDRNIPFLKISTFQNQIQAVLYLQSLFHPTVSFLQFEVAEHIFIINQSNLNHCIRTKSFKAYIRYYHQKYPYLSSDSFRR